MNTIALIQDAIEYIEKNLKDELSVTQIAERTGLSSWHFQRLFHEHVGETIGSYIRRRRLSSSLDMLRFTDHKVIDIAFEYQFNSSEAYSRALKAEFGLSPLQFRQQKPKIIPQKKPVLSERQLNYLVHDMKLEPEIRTISAISVVGLPASFPSPLSQRAQYMSEVPRLWRQFVSREHEIANQVGAIKVGVIEGMATSKHHIHDDLMDYLASTPVSAEAPPPPGMSFFTIPGGTYAVFQAKGYHEQTQYIIDYVYSTWLPTTAEYERAHGPEFTWLDHRDHPLDPIHSLVEYFLPVHPL